LSEWNPYSENAQITSLKILGLDVQSGHRFFFLPEEVVPLKREVCNGR
jgi:hypothetical protein